MKNPLAKTFSVKFPIKKVNSSAVSFNSSVFLRLSKPVVRKVKLDLGKFIPGIVYNDKQFESYAIPKQICHNIKIIDKPQENKEVPKHASTVDIKMRRSQTFKNIFCNKSVMFYKAKLEKFLMR